MIRIKVTLTTAFFKFLCGVLERGIFRSLREFTQTEIGKFDDPSGINQAVSGVQRSVKTHRGLVEVYHPLSREKLVVYFTVYPFFA